jgi:peroxiredoxin
VAEYQAAWGQFQAENIGLIAASVDSAQRMQRLADKAGVAFPMGINLDAEAVSRATGAFYEPERRFLHATGFVLRPGGTIEVACYSTGPIGRLAAEQVLSLIRYYRSRQ